MAPATPRCLITAHRQAAPGILLKPPPHSPTLIILNSNPNTDEHEDRMEAKEDVGPTW
uniref:Uncharacterized protein n=1 Tax=Arundo donax TaxID=35708 RepID=A0A0A8YJQ3_ARUDO